MRRFALLAMVTVLARAAAAEDRPPTTAPPPVPGVDAPADPAGRAGPDERSGPAERSGAAERSGPAENAAYVPDDADAVRRALARAEAALASHDVLAAVRAFQAVAEGPADAVVAVGEPGLYEGATAVAHHRIVRAGRAALAAYQGDFGPRARDALAAAVPARDVAAIEDVAMRYLPTDEGRTALLVLADLATERGDADDALGRLERLADLEDAAAPDLAEEVVRWRAARRERLARLHATDDASLAALRARATAGDDPTGRGGARPAPGEWPTSGGNAARSALPSGVGARPALGWIGTLGSADAFVPVPDADERPAPSPWVPPRAVVTRGRVYVNDGTSLHAFETATGREAWWPPLVLAAGRPEGASAVVGGEARRTWGLIEGHALTVVGDVAYACVAGTDDGPRAPLEIAEPDPADVSHLENGLGHVLAVRLRERQGEVLWQAGGRAATPGMPPGLRLFGAPLLYRGRLWVAGARRTVASADRHEAWVVSLDPETGAVRSATFLASGDAARRQRGDEVAPSSCAGARGRVLVVTSLGVVAAVDASNGRTCWSLRHDRARPDGDDLGRRLLENERDDTPRPSGFSNEPPLLHGDVCVVAPVDARKVFVLADRPRGPRRLLRLWERDRTRDFLNLAVEQLVGIAPAREGRPALLVVAGAGHRAPGEIHTCVAALALEDGAMRWQRALPHGGEPQPYGRALLTDAEVFVPTEAGIAGYRLADGADLPFLGADAVDPDVLTGPESGFVPRGNLVPVPGVGFLAVDAGRLSLWRSRK